MKNKIGSTIIEAVIGLALIGMLSTVVIEFLGNKATSEEMNQRRLKLIQLVQMTHADLSSKPIAYLPQVGKCKVRMYSMDMLPTQGFDDSIEYDLASDMCRIQLPDTAGWKIVIRSEPFTEGVAGSADVTFDDEVHMKLPTISQSVKQIRITGGYQAFKENRKADAKALAITVFRRS